VARPVRLDERKPKEPIGGFMLGSFCDRRLLLRGIGNYTGSESFFNPYVLVRLLTKQMAAQ